MFVTKQRRGRGVNGAALGVSVYRRGPQIVLVVVAHQNVIEPNLISTEA